MNKSTIFPLFFTALLLLTGKAFALTELTASVDKNPVMVNESFVLQIVADESMSSSDLDLSALVRSGLTVGRTSTSSQTQIINGNISKTTTWSTLLLARQKGEYVIPAIEVDGVKTQPIKVSVIESANQSGQDSQPIFLKNRIESDSLYLQQTVKLVTRLYFSPNVNLQSGTLTDPVLSSANIKQQGKDQESSEIIMGMRYRVIERIYTLTPQTSGDFTITSPTFNGEVSTDRRRSVFSTFNNRKPVSTIGNDITIRVMPIPNDYQGSWLPSDLVQLNDEFQPQQSVYQVGEPITRTFTLTALNVNEEQLPELKGSYPSSFNVYPDQSESHSVLRQNAIVSQRVSSEAIVATKPGSYTLPAVSINWFNTKTQQVETATIPEQTLTIEAAESDAENALITNVPLQQQDITAHACPEPSPAEAMSCPALLSDDNNQLLITLSGWGVWLITLILWFFTRNQGGKTQTSSSIKAQNTGEYSATELKQACHNNDHVATRNALIKWAVQRFGDEFRHLSKLQTVVSDELAQAIAELNQSQYSRDKHNWNGTKLWQLVKSETRSNSDKKTNDLPPLN